MDTNSSHSSKNRNRDILRYAGLGTQMLAAIGIAVFFGLKLDHWLQTSPLMACVLPLLALFGMFYKLVRETGNKKKNDSK